MKEKQANQVHNPHDAFFKKEFSRPELAAAYLEKVLPQKIVANINLNNLKPDLTSYVDDYLKSHFCDVTYSSTYKENPVKISFLLEHKSFVPTYPHLQLIQYMLNIWKTCEYPKKPLPVIIPIVLYHGEDKWIYKPFKDYFENIPGELIGFVPAFDYIFNDIHIYSDDELAKGYFAHPLLNIDIYVLKNSNNKEELFGGLEKMLKLGTIFMKTKHWVLYLQSLVIYLFSITNKEDENKYRDSLIENIRHTGGDVMTILEHYIKKGEKKGKLDDAKEMLKDGVPVNKIVKYTKLSLKQIEELKRSLGLE